MEAVEAELALASKRFSQTKSALLKDDGTPTQTLVEGLEKTLSDADLTSPSLSLFGFAKPTETAGDEPAHKMTQTIAGKTIIFSNDSKPLDLQNAREFDGKKPFSVAVWLKPNSYGAILSRMDVDNAYRGFDMLLSADGRLSVHLIHNWPANAIKVTCNNVFQKGEFAHVVVSYDGSGTAKGIQVFMNGVATRLKTKWMH